MARQEFPVAVRRAAWERCGGRCEEPTCRAWLMPGDYQYDHDIADGLGGKPTLENVRVLCGKCHLAKTRFRDVPAIAKVKRISRKEQEHRDAVDAREPGQPRTRRGKIGSRGFPKQQRRLDHG